MFSFYHSSLFSSELNIKDEIRLPIPDKKNHLQPAMEPRPYQRHEPGEYVDVDLPDEIKAKKYKKVISLDKAVPEQNTADHATEGRPNNSKYFSVQVSMFKNIENAQRLKQKLLKQYSHVFIARRNNLKQQARYDVRFGQYLTRQQAETALMKYNAAFNAQAFIVSQ
ncbi:MAG: SPOR domain-containing protein [Gammaproteobacteria bacterium]|nr:SPOR domain-containing protein [Gammaproteobacteria bacterium]